MVKVLDASAILLFFEKKPGYEQVRQLFLDAAANKCTLLITSVNWGEVRYILINKHGKSDPLKAKEALRSLPVRLVDVDQEIASIAGDLKVEYKMGYCDAMAAALAKLHKAECITTDSDFNSLKNEIKINLINKGIA
jgi:predicted nucleic acid-binding protein